MGYLEGRSSDLEPTSKAGLTRQLTSLLTVKLHRLPHLHVEFLPTPCLRRYSVMSLMDLQV